MFGVRSLYTDIRRIRKGLVINLIKLSLRSPPLCKNSKNMSQQKIGSQTQNLLCLYNRQKLNANVLLSLYLREKNVTF